MGLLSELYLTISIAFMSVIITIITTIAALFLTTYFYGKQKQEIIIRKLRHHESSRSKSKSNEANQNIASNKDNHNQQNDQTVISTSPKSISMSPKSISKSSARANTTENSIKNHSESVNDRDKDIGSYFKFTASVTLIFGAFNAFFNSWYCIWLLFDPAYDDPMFYVQHPSHIHRITSTGIYQFT